MLGVAHKGCLLTHLMTHGRMRHLRLRYSSARKHPCGKHDEQSRVR